MDLDVLSIGFLWISGVCCLARRHPQLWSYPGGPLFVPWLQLRLNQSLIFGVNLFTYIQKYPVHFKVDLPLSVQCWYTVAIHFLSHDITSISLINDEQDSCYMHAVIYDT